MDSILDKVLVLSLNKSWQPIGQKTVRQAILSMTGGDGHGCLGLEIDYQIKNGDYDFSSPVNMRPLPFNEWIKLPVREFDFSVQSVNFAMRVPTVIICTNFNKMPIRKLYPTKKRIWERDNGVCQYTGKKLNRKNASVDHVIPKTKGGKSTWENLVICDRKVNFDKGNKLNSEIGLRLLRQPKEPLAQFAFSSIKEIRSNDWKHFIINS